MSGQITFGAYVRQRREAKGWTQPEAAAQIGIEQSYLSKLETGKSFPSDEVYGRLAKGLSIDIKDMGAALCAADLQKLKDVAAIRDALLERRKGQRKLVRGWMLAGLGCLMLGGVCVGAAAAYPALDIYEFRYRSIGVIEPGEPLDAFDIVEETLKRETPAFEERSKLQQKMILRIDEEFRTITDFRGDSFIEAAFEGRRKFEQFDQRLAQEKMPPLRWLLAPGFMFFAASIGCFHIARRWE